MENVFKKTAKAFSLFLLFAGVSCFLGANQTVAFQEGFSSRNLTYEETFENGDAWTGDCYAYQQFAGSHSFKAIENPVYMEKFCGKFELRYGDPMVTKNGGPRAEVLFGEQSHRERWYSFAVFFPSYGWKLDMDDEIVSQWHASNGTPPLALRVKNGKLRLRIGHTDGSSIKFNYLEFGDVPKDEWNEFVFHVIHSEKSDGLVEVWKNGKKLATHKGPNLYSDGKHVRWKIGIYKSNWSKKSTDVNLRVTYFDNVRIGDENSSLEDMITSNSKVSAPIPVSGISTTPNTISLQVDRQIQISANISPSDASNKSVTWSSSNTGVATVKDGLVTGVKTGTAIITAKTQDGNFTSKSSISVTSESQPLSINNFTLIDASTNTSIKPLEDGDILEYNQLKDLILNFRAHTFPETIGSVAISLSGPAQSSRTDNGFSYDLLNNDGIRLPEGKYTLTAVPYSERENGGTEGAALSIQFILADANKVIIPDCPLPTSPTNGSNGVISTVNLEWTKSEGSESYSIQVAEDEQFQTNLISLENITGNTAEIKNLKAAKSYFWKIKANNQHGSSTFSEPWYFLTNKETSELVKVTGLTVGPSTLSLDQGNSSTLEASVSPSNAQNKMLNWSSSNISVATVDENGLVTAIGEGSAAITAMTEDGGFTATSNVTVSAKEAQLAVQNFSLVDETSNSLISKIANGDRLDYNQVREKSINFRASTYPEEIGSVDFSLEGPVSSSRTDNGFAYELLNNNGLGLLEGEYTLTATPYSLREKGGEKGTPLSIRFTISAPNTVTGVTINHSSLNLEKGSSSLLEATVSPSGALNETVSWSSSNSSVATVDKNGWVSAVGQGTATITAMTEDGGFTATSNVTVSAKEVQLAVQNFSLVNATSNTVISKITDGDQLDYRQLKDLSVNFRASTYPEKIGSVDFSLEGPVSSSRTDNGFAYELLNNNGLGLLEGEYTLTATPYSVREKGGEKGTPLSIRFTISAPNTVTGVTINHSSLNLEKGSSSLLEATVSPSGALNETVSWSSSNSSVATVDENGWVSAVGQGTATITAMTEDGGFTATSNVTVSAKEVQLAVQNFSLVNATSNTVISKITDGDQLDYRQLKDLSVNFRASTYPEKIGSVDFSLEGPVSSSRTDNGFAYELLNNNGLGLLEGEYTLTATPYSVREKGGEKGTPLSIRFTISAPNTVTGVTINHSSLNLEKGSSSLLEATVSPSGALNETVSWSSSNSSVATVDENGWVSAVGQGTATITAMTEDGGFTATSNVTVSAKEVQLAVQNFSLVNATSNTVISKITDGDQLDYRQLKDLSVNFRASTYPEKIGSVDFSLEGPVSSSRTDNGFAYELLNNNGLGLLEGEYTLTATPYSIREKGGEKGSPLSIRFTVSTPLPVLPGIPEPVSPAKESIGLPTVLVLDWNQVDLAEAYEVQIADNDNFNNPVVNEQNINASEWEVSGLKEETKYYWRVRATAEAGQSNWSETWMFETERIPVEETPNPAMQITIVLEVGNSLGLSTMITGSDSNHKSIIWSSSNERIVEVNAEGKVTALSPGEAIITAKTSEGKLSSSITIIVKEIEMAFGIEGFQMVDNATKSVIHTLSDGEAIDIHQARDLDLNFRAVTSSPVIKSVFFSLTGPVNSSRTDNGYQFELLSNMGLKLIPGNYTLSAVPYTERDKGGEKGNAYSIRFTVSGEEQRKLDNAPDLISPSNNDTVDPNAVQFFWIDHTSSDQYEVEVSRSTDFRESDLIKSGPIKDNQLGLDGLEYGMDYYWRVKARKDGEWGNYSTIWKFQTEEQPKFELENPLLVSPGLGETIHQSELRLNWKAVEQATHFKVYISTDKDFIENVKEYENLLDTVLVVSELEQNREYFWKVEAGHTQTRKISEIWDFKTASAEMTEGLRVAEAPLTVTMFPNPSRDIVNLELGNISDGLIQVTLSELNGNTVFSKMMENHEGLTTLNLSNIKPGIYLVSVLANRQSKVIKLIKK